MGEEEGGRNERGKGRKGERKRAALQMKFLATQLLSSTHDHAASGYKHAR